MSSTTNSEIDYWTKIWHNDLQGQHGKSGEVSTSPFFLPLDFTTSREKEQESSRLPSNLLSSIDLTNEDYNKL